jgi:hypothetical protein
MSRDLERDRKEEEKVQAERARQLLEEDLDRKKTRLGEEPLEGEEGVVIVVFRKPIGNERISRRFRKDSPVEALYDFIDLQLSQDNKVGFETNIGQSPSDIRYEIVTPPTP